MIFFISNLFISFFIFLFCLYWLSKDDFILLRKSITLEQIFNYAFIGALIALLSGRIMHVFLHPSLQYLNPLVFLVFIYFPGLSVIGSVIGVLIFLLLISRKKKIPRGRICDVFSLSFLPAFASNLLITQIGTLIMTKKISLPILISSVVFFVLFIIFAAIFQKGKIKDGTASISTLLTFSLILFLEDIFMLKNKRALFFDKEIIVLFLMILAGIILLIYQKIGRKRR